MHRSIETPVRAKATQNLENRKKYNLFLHGTCHSDNFLTYIDPQMSHMRFSVCQLFSEYKTTLSETAEDTKGLIYLFIYSCHLMFVLFTGITIFTIRKILQLRTHHEISTLWCYKVFKRNWIQGYYLCSLFHVNVGVTMYSLLMLFKNKNDFKHQLFPIIGMCLHAGNLLQKNYYNSEWICIFIVPLYDFEVFFSPLFSRRLLLTT